MRALTGGLIGDCGEYPHYMPCTIVRVVELVKMQADRLTQQKRANQGFGIRGQGVLVLDRPRQVRTKEVTLQ